MSAAEEFTYDRAVIDGGAARPSIDDLGGEDWQDDADYPPPRNGEDLYADAVKQVWQQVAAAHRVLPSAIISVTFSVGVPSIASVRCCSAVLTPADFTVTDNGTGDTSITWAAGKLPPTEAEPEVSANWTPCFIEAHNIVNGVQVISKDSTNTAVNANFTVRIN